MLILKGTRAPSGIGRKPFAFLTESAHNDPRLRINTWVNSLEN